MDRRVLPSPFDERRKWPFRKGGIVEHDGPGAPPGSFGLRGSGFSAFSSRMASDPLPVAFGGLPPFSLQKRFHPEALKFCGFKTEAYFLLGLLQQRV